MKKKKKWFFAFSKFWCPSNVGIRWEKNDFFRKKRKKTHFQFTLKYPEFDEKFFGKTIFDTYYISVIWMKMSDIFEIFVSKTGSEKCLKYRQYEYFFKEIFKISLMRWMLSIGFSTTKTSFFTENLIFPRFSIPSIIVIWWRNQEKYFFLVLFDDDIYRRIDQKSKHFSIKFVFPWILDTLNNGDLVKKSRKIFFLFC